MGAENQQRRTATAKQMAARFGVSDRTVRRIMAEPRVDFLARTQRRRDQAVKLRAEGLKQAQIAARLNVTQQTVSRLLREAADRDTAARDAAATAWAEDEMTLPEDSSTALRGTAAAAYARSVLRAVLDHDDAPPQAS